MEYPAQPAAPPQNVHAGNGRHSRIREWDAVKDLGRSGMRVARLEVRIWMARLKLTAIRLAIIGTAVAVSAVLGILAAIFFYVGCFRLLTDVLGLQTAWACLIFAAAHVLVIALLSLVAYFLIRQGKPT
jgi:hypothetical protein